VATKSARKAPSLAPFYERVNKLIASYHDALCALHGLDVSIAKKADDDRATAMRALAEKYYEMAMDAGVSEAELVLGADVSPGMVADLRAYLADALDSNDGYVEDSLLPAIDNAEAPLEGEALVDRLGMYADQVFPVANTGLIKSTSGSGLIWEWVLDEAADHCEGTGSCPELADGGPYSDPDDDESDLPSLPTFPGVDTLCGARCRCTVSITNESWNAYNKANDSADEES
jgi:hypothetical protein